MSYEVLVWTKANHKRQLQPTTYYDVIEFSVYKGRLCLAFEDDTVKVFSKKLWRQYTATPAARQEPIS